MPKITRIEIVKLHKVCDAEGKEYGKHNWRSKCVGGQGLLIFKESLRQHPGQMYLTFFFTREKDERMAPFFDKVEISFGFPIKDDSEGFVFHAENSSFYFKYDDVNFSDAFKESLLNYGRNEAYRLEQKEKETLRTKRKLVS